MTGNMAKIQQFIKENYKEMYIHWLQYSNNGFYENRMEQEKRCQGI